MLIKNSQSEKVRIRIFDFYQNFDIFLRKLVEGVALLLEDLDVGGEQVLPLHPFASGHRSNEESCIDVTEDKLNFSSSTIQSCHMLLIHAFTANSSRYQVITLVTEP